MTGPPEAMLPTESAPSVNRAPETVLVRLHNGDLVGRVSVEFAEMLLASDAAVPVGRDRLRYLRLLPGVVVAKRSHGWALIDEERRKHGDKAVRRNVMAFDRRSLKWQPPKARVSQSEPGSSCSRNQDHKQPPMGGRHAGPATFTSSNRIGSDR
jgi:hypothetical protein